VSVLSTAPAVTAGFAAEGLAATELPIHDTGLREARILARALRALEVDALVAEKPRDLRLGAMASLARRFALVYRHNVGQATPPRDPIVRLAYTRVALTIFLTHTGARDVLEQAPFMGRPPHRVIHEGVDVQRFRPDPEAGRAFRRRHGLGDGTVLLAVGALEQEKRYDWLLDALARLAAAPPLLVCGEGPLAGAVGDQAARRRLDVRLLGRLAAPDLAAAYDAATCLVHAGPYETFGLAVAEAMACGRPVVAVAGGALPEVLADAGVLAPPDDPGLFAQRLGDLLADPARQEALGARARRRALEAFSLQRMAQEYAEALAACRGDLS
jgi:glycosyltransferase involved in cell wall biosynthesis